MEPGNISCENTSAESEEGEVWKAGDEFHISKQGSTVEATGILLRKRFVHMTGFGGCFRHSAALYNYLYTRGS